MATASEALDRLTIMERLNRYAWGYDVPDLEMLKDSFTCDAVFFIHMKDGKEWGPLRGRDLIVDWMANVKKTQSGQRRHSITGVLFDELAQEHATVRCFLVVTSAGDDTVNLVTTGGYRIELGREGSAWRIRKLELLLDAAF
jgi:hypothetical protein